ncbi:transmembrane protein PVRIG [Onychomys torridus]|uniref:transmembrane protein PVRIG n=1 Tax=Onychomys torridus TaxID=38674 RepID=UPI00167FD252|nr:transmembrane protein PVRIG [Onychomys torridus]
MAQAQALALFSSLLTVCVSEGSPEVWVRVHMEATRLSSLSLSVRCGVLGTNLISLVTVIWEGFVDAQGTKLAVLHPDLGTQWWVPASQARWETSNSVSLTLTLEQSKAKTSLANTTFCCEFVTFPHGSRVACGRLHSSDPGLSAPTPVPILQADLARILGTSGFLLLGFIFILYLLWRQKHWCFRKSRPSPTSTQAHMEAQLLRSPSAHGSFVSTENGLYASAGETLPHPVPNSLASTDCLEHATMQKLPATHIWEDQRLDPQESSTDSSCCQSPQAWLPRCYPRPHSLDNAA